MQNPEQPNTPTDFPAYPAYKPSGIEWLGDIPSHWDVRWLKYLARNISQPTSERVEGELRLGLEHVESWTGKYEIAENVRFESRMKRFQPDDVLFGKLRPYLAKVTRPDRAGICMGDFLVLRAKSSLIVAGFLEYVMRSKYVIDLIDSSAVGAKMPRADWTFIGNVWLPLPPLPEQRAIAAYLDRKGAIARRYAHVARHIIDTLRELRQVEIHDAVTRGLNEDIPLKPSGVKYLVDVPAHWDVLPLKRIGRFRSGAGFPIIEQGQKDLELPFFKVSDMNLPGNEQVMRSWNNSVSRNTADRLNAAILPAGTIIFPKVGGALLTNKRRVLERPSCVDNNIMCCVVQRGDIDFVRYVFDNIDLGMIAKPGPLPAVNERDVRDIRAPFPPLAEQRAIAEYLDAKTAAIDAAIAHYERMAELVAEYWTVLVVDAVTGRIDLRQAAPE